VLSAFVAVDFQAIYSEEAKPYFGAIWDALLDSIADLAVAEAPYVSDSLQDFVVICFGDFNGARLPTIRRPSLCDFPARRLTPATQMTTTSASRTCCSCWVVPPPLLPLPLGCRVFDVPRGFDVRTR
jgi:hypothetical protein